MLSKRPLLVFALFAALSGAIFFSWRSVRPATVATSATAAASGSQAAESPAVQSTQLAASSGVITPLWTLSATPSPVPATAATSRIKRTFALTPAGNPQLGKLTQGAVIVLPLADGREVRGLVNLVVREASGLVRVGGSLTDAAGSFSLGQDQSGLGGRVLLRGEKLAYVIRSDHGGVMHEVALANVICFPFAPDATPAAARPQLPQGIPPALQSRPGAAAVLYLDFDGATVTDPDWNDGHTINAAASSLTNAEITQVWNRVKEDFAPFDINITTVAADYTAAAVGRRMRVIITPTDAWYPEEAGGIAWVDSFVRAGGGVDWFSSDIPAWVFNTSVDGVAEAISHELGHTLGLVHDGRTSPLEEYYGGHGSGATSWAPIMGVGYDRNVVQWSKGEYPNVSNTEDDVAIISGSQPTPWSIELDESVSNNTGYVSDEAGNSRATATTLDLSGNSLTREGVVSAAADADFYVFTLGATRNVTVNATPANSTAKQPNLDIALEIQNDSGTVLASANPADALNASLTAALPAGTYYIRVAGTGRPAATGPDQGYSTYGSIGQYTLATTATNDLTAPAITSQSAGLDSTPGAYSQFYITASGSPILLYQWQRLPSGTATWLNLDESTTFTGVHSTRLQVAGLVTLHGDQFRCVVSNAAGSATSTPTTLTVASSVDALAWVAINMPSQGFTGSQASGTITVTNAGTQPWGPTHKMLLKDSTTTVASVSLNGVAAGATATITIPFIVPVDPFLSFAYTLQATHEGVGEFGGSRSFSFSTRGAEIAPNIITHPLSRAAHVGDNLSFSVLALGKTPFSYQWKKNGTNIEGATSSTLWLTSIPVGAAGTYTVVVTNPLGSATSNPATLTVAVPPGVIAATGGLEGTVFLRADGSRWGMGRNQYGELGGGGTLSFTQPTQFEASGIVQTAMRDEVGAFVKSDGTLWLMGSRIDTLVAGAATYQTTPIQVPGVTDVSQVAICGYYSVSIAYLRRDGTLWTMGRNTNGQLGDGTTTNRSTPVKIADNVTAVAGGSFHFVFLKSDGTAWGCGSGGSDRLGTTVSGDINSTPVLLGNDVVGIDARWNFTLLLKADGKLRMQGYGPPLLYGGAIVLATDVAKFSAGDGHVLFIKSDGSLWGVGGNSSGQLGNGTRLNQGTPVLIATGVRSASAGGEHSLFFKNDGALWGMGKNAIYQLGIPTGLSYSTEPIMLANGALPLPATAGIVTVTVGVVATNAHLSWDYCLGASSYEVWRNTVNAATGAVRIGTTDGVNFFDDRTRQAGTTYYYWVKPVNAAGAGVFVGTPQITRQPSDYSYSTHSATLPEFSIVAQGIPTPSYRWQTAPAGTANWTDVSPSDTAFSGGLNSTLRFNRVEESHAGLKIRCIVSNTSGMVTSNAATLTVTSASVPGDIDGDGISEVVWRYTPSGLIATWTSSSGYLVLGTEDANWKAVGSGDFDGDGRTDMLWRYGPAGLIASWTSTAGYLTLGTEDANWKIVTTGDFDADGQSDVLWRYVPTGRIASWTSSAGYLNLGTEDANWQAISAGDFDGDGYADVLWRHVPTGRIVTWASGGSYLSIGTEDTNWRYLATGDYDGDGTTDVLWRYVPTGLISSWTSSAGYRSLGSEGSGWIAVGN